MATTLPPTTNPPTTNPPTTNPPTTNPTTNFWNQQVGTVLPMWALFAIGGGALVFLLLLIIALR